MITVVASFSTCLIIFLLRQFVVEHYISKKVDVLSSLLESTQTRLNNKTMRMLGRISLGKDLLILLSLPNVSQETVLKVAKEYFVTNHGRDFMIKYLDEYLKNNQIEIPLWYTKIKENRKHD